jgi:hypothetical protein
MIRVRQKFDCQQIENIEETLSSEIANDPGYGSIRPGMRIAIAVGSRGITKLPLCVKVIVEMLKRKGADPFIVPAMGSHGGATASGQKDMLETMGIREAHVGAPIRATMETVDLGQTAKNRLPVVIDRHAHEADGIVIINRIKPHVAFQGTYESGLMKMITIGLGKQRGAENCHRLGFGSMAENIREIADTVIEKQNILFAVGIIENAYHQTYALEVMGKREIAVREPDMLLLAKKLAPRLYFDQLDVLIMDEIGKDISGTGFDTSVVGRYHTPYISGGPDITRIGVLDLTERSHGNANGIGIVDFTTRRLFDKFIPEQTYPNSLTSTVPISVKIPMVLASDLLLIKAAIKTCQIPDFEQVRLVRFKNTIALDEIEISENLLTEAEQSDQMEVLSEPYLWAFDDAGNFNNPG